MKALLMEIKESVREEAALGGRCLGAPEQVEEFERRYQELLDEGLEANPPPPPEPETGKEKKRGQPKQSKGKNLVDRLEKYREWVLRGSCTISGCHSPTTKPSGTYGW